MYWHNGDAEHLSELNEGEFLELKTIIDKLENAITAAFGATHFNWTCLMNNYYKPKNIGKPKQLHWHLWPRYKETVHFEGEIFRDEVFGHHYDKTKEKLVSAALLEKIGERLRREL